VKLRGVFRQATVRITGQKDRERCSRASDSQMIVLNCCKTHGKSYTSTGTSIGDRWCFHYSCHSWEFLFHLGTFISLLRWGNAQSNRSSLYR